MRRKPHGRTRENQYAGRRRACALLFMGVKAIVIGWQRRVSGKGGPPQRGMQPRQRNDKKRCAASDSLLFSTSLSTTISSMNFDCNISVDARATYVLETLEQAGYSAWLVGGCVRDALMGNTANDYDIATSAPWRQTSTLFKAAGCNVAETGVKHGTVTVVVDSMPFEVTTYRIDGLYSDARHPDNVTFSDSITDDLARRDFRINAIAYHPDRGILDPYEGMEDIRQRRLCAVGNPFDRLAEDPLRILRGLRFAAKLGFSIERKTQNAIRQNAALLQSVSKERIFAELSSLLCSPYAQKVLLEYPEVFDVLIEGIDAMAKQPFDPRETTPSLLEHAARVLGKVPADPALRFAALLHDKSKTHRPARTNGPFNHAEESAHQTRHLLAKLKSPRSVREKTCRIVARHNEYVPPTKEGVATLVALERGDVSFVRDLLVFQRSDIESLEGLSSCAREANLRLEVLDELVRTHAPLTRTDLAINGADVKNELGVSGRAIGLILDSALCAVIEGLPNERDTLLSHISNMKNIAPENLFEKKFKKLLDANMLNL